MNVDQIRLTMARIEANLGHWIFTTEEPAFIPDGRVPTVGVGGRARSPWRSAARGRG